MPTLTYPHWRDVPANTWRWPNFSAAEIACRGTGAIKINTEAMDKLQALRDRLGKALIIRSAYRSPEHNRAVGGAPPRSTCRARPLISPCRTTILRPSRRRRGQWASSASAITPLRLHAHRPWSCPVLGRSLPARPVPFAPELPPAREVLSESRTLRGGGAAGAATVGAAGVEAVRGVLAETQSTIQPLVPYLDTLRWVLIAIALIGIAVTIHARLDDWKRGQR
ncbi:D-Ala-D-Ala carboxypeptidase family metallohydrolase [Rhodobacter capsulatus]|nr:D-Ala-D-Ala carboxypeptidase family metallohydrolase [Rhodobacter capsulatus]WER10434.1 D-Ala-D-Ala carboxypeptidase family metallohydrolase [Rhodobacter capsulatus]